ncbi:hypothetical protein TNIN_224421 [Trichonephila inaurata madagascariensis]|uniref:Uncharacterized protein n=1 Tax=Trichonephila inaurata madagascariensis TaxID=2747483 RepID=A0A8X6YT81_9ARAC|nr:hypothetical protein TNIN_224421 [Trichonephila inaurata madagascariensis]
MFKNCRKEDLRIVALELGETVAEKVAIVELTEIIKEKRKTVNRDLFVLSVKRGIIKRFIIQGERKTRNVEQYDLSIPVKKIVQVELLNLIYSVILAAIATSSVPPRSAKLKLGNPEPTK